MEVKSKYRMIPKRYIKNSEVEKHELCVLEQIENFILLSI